MRKTITYSTFILASAVVVILFVTAKNYTQLALAVILYPGIAYLVLNLFPRRNEDHEVTIQLHSNEASVIAETTEPTPITARQKVDIADVDKRAFLKLIGVAGLSFFVLSIFSKKAQIPFLGKLGGSDTVSVKDSKGVAIDPAERQPLDGYQISEIDDSIVAYYGFINKSGSWFIMREDTDTNSFRYAKGEKSFPSGWKNRTKLNYDYFYNI